MAKSMGNIAKELSAKGVHIQYANKPAKLNWRQADKNRRGT